MANLNNIIKLTQEQYDELVDEGTLDIDENTTITYDPNSVYLVDGDDLRYLTANPTGPNTSGLVKIVVLDSEPETKYDGYIYLIKSNS